MSKSSTAERNHRINWAITLLGKQFPSAQVIAELQERFGVSERQAYRYLQEAEQAKALLLIPEQKVVFTVKLPKSLAQRMREYARATGQSVSDIVTRALERILSHGERHG